MKSFKFSGADNEALSRTVAGAILALTDDPDPKVRRTARMFVRQLKKRDYEICQFDVRVSLLAADPIRVRNAHIAQRVSTIIGKPASRHTFTSLVKLGGCALKSIACRHGNRLLLQRSGITEIDCVEGHPLSKEAAYKIVAFEANLSAARVKSIFLRPIGTPIGGQFTVRT